MKKRPLLFYFIAIAFSVLAISFPLQVMWNYQFPLQKAHLSFSFLTTTNMALILAYSGLAYFSLNASRAIVALLPFSLALTLYNNYLVGSWAYDYSMQQTLTASALFATFSLFPFLPSYLKSLRNPKCRWWMVATRKPIEVPVRVSPTVGSRFHSFTVDMSSTGAFIETHGDHLDLGDEGDLRFSAQSV